MRSAWRSSSSRALCFSCGAQPCGGRFSASRAGAEAACVRGVPRAFHTLAICAGDNAAASARERPRPSADLLSATLAGCTVMPARREMPASFCASKARNRFKSDSTLDSSDEASSMLRPVARESAAAGCSSEPAPTVATTRRGVRETLRARTARAAPGARLAREEPRSSGGATPQPRPATHMPLGDSCMVRTTRSAEG